MPGVKRSPTERSEMPVFSRSEWGAFRQDGTKDMKVLRKRARGALMWWNNGKPRTEMQMRFGYPFSIIHNGKLVDSDFEYQGNVIIRELALCSDGFYKGFAVLRYHDSYNDGRGIGGTGNIIIDDVRDVSVKGDHLVISGYSQLKPVEYRYLIQDEADTKPFVRPIPKKSKEPDVQRPAPKPKNEVPKKEAPKGSKEKPKKTVPRSAPKKSVPKPAPKKEEKVRNAYVFEVRVDGKVEGSFSSRPKAERMMKELRKKGLKARVYGVWCR